MAYELRQPKAAGHTSDNTAGCVAREAVEGAAARYSRYRPARVLQVGD
jgi:hypothetical protein